jgi:hypothetical protein
MRLSWMRTGMTYDLCYYLVEELQEATTSIIDRIPKAKLIQIFQTWTLRFEKCIQQEGAYFESTESDAANNICFYSWEVG